jgi:hypothetical protein
VFKERPCSSGIVMPRKSMRLDLLEVGVSERRRLGPFSGAG